LSHATVHDVRTGAGTRIRYNDLKMGRPVIPRSVQENTNRSVLENDPRPDFPTK